MLKIADGLTLPVELAGRRTAIFGISGSGKSNTATVLIEQLLHAGEQVVLIDPKGEGWGLLSLANGKPSNLPIIVFGEPNGHIETLAETHGSRLADFVVETGRSVVLSLLGFESDQSERRFVAAFLRQLYRRKSRQGQPTRTLVVLEEAHLFVPESQGRGFKGDAAELSGAVQRIARQGRTFGIGTLLVDQRPQDVSKRVVTQCDTLICHQLVHKLDRDALREWVRGYDVDGSGEQFLESLASLEPGEAWIWSPAWLKIFQRIKVHRRKTFDSGAAPDGSEAARTVKRQEVDLDALRGQLAEIVDKAKADDPKELKKTIAELRRQLAQQPTETKVETKIEYVDVPVLKNGQLERTEKVIGRLELIGAKVVEQATALREQIAPAAAPRPSIPKTTPAPQRQAVHVAPRPKPSIAPSTNGTFQPNRAQQRILDALAWYESLGNTRPTQTQIGAVALIDPAGGYFSNTVGPLSTEGLVIRGNGDLILTDAGRALANVPESVGTLAEYHDVLRERVRKMRSASNKTIDMLNVVIESNGDSVTTEQIGQAVSVDHTGGYFSNSIGPLSTAGLITRRAGVVTPTEVLFPAGLS